MNAPAKAAKLTIIEPRTFHILAAPPDSHFFRLLRAANSSRSRSGGHFANNPPTPIAIPPLEAEADIESRSGCVSSLGRGDTCCAPGRTRSIGSRAEGSRAGRGAARRCWAVVGEEHEACGEAEK